MKKLFLVLLVFLIIGGSAFAFDIMSYPPALGGGGAIMIDTGVGLTWDGIIFNTIGSLVGKSKMVVPPIFLDAQFALPNIPLSVGTFAAYEQSKWTRYGDWDAFWRIHLLTVGAKADWHWGFDMKMLDVYSGLSLGWRFQWSNWGGYGIYGYDAQNYGGFSYGGHVGVHFYFTPIIGAMVEAGYPFIVKAGVALKFGNFGGGGGSSGGSSGGKYIVNTDTLNVRSGPSADNPVVGTLQRGASVNVIDKSAGTWWKIKSGNIEGYVNSTLLKED